MGSNWCDLSQEVGVYNLEQRYREREYETDEEDETLDLSNSFFFHF